VLQPAVAGPVAVEVAEVQQVGVGAERPAAAWAWLPRVELGEELGAEVAVLVAVATLGAGATLPVLGPLTA
jgi:hypothetical protein